MIKFLVTYDSVWLSTGKFVTNRLSSKRGYQAYKYTLWRLFMNIIILIFLLTLSGASSTSLATSLPPCSEKITAITSELDIFIPLASYQSIDGDSNVWAQFEFEGYDPDMGLFWKIIDYGEIQGGVNCDTVPKVSIKINLDIHIYSSEYQSDESTSNIWVDLEYYGEGLDSEGKGTGNFLWKLKNAGVNLIN